MRETTNLTKIDMKSSEIESKQDGSYQGKALNVPTAFLGLWSSNSLKKDVKN